MNERAQKIWDAFCGELIQEPTDDVREALSTAIREVANELQYYNFGFGEVFNSSTEDMILDARDLYDLADELEALK